MRWGRAAWWMLQGFFALWMVAVLRTEGDCGYGCDPHAGRGLAAALLIAVWLAVNVAVLLLACLVRGARGGR
jgi:hypothetical protein